MARLEGADIAVHVGGAGDVRCMRDGGSRCAAFDDPTQGGTPDRVAHKCGSSAAGERDLGRAGSREPMTFGDRGAQRRGSAPLERRENVDRSAAVHRTDAGRRIGAPARTMICDRSGPTETYETGMPAARSTNDT